MPISPGQTLAHYLIAEPLGQGGMGVVWKAHDTSLGRDVALKFLPEFFAADPERLSRFDREARLLASLNHPRVASIYGFHMVAEARFLALELVPGEDLAQRLARGALPLEEALRIALQIAEALEHAHEKGVIHRDLKPANVKLDAEGDVKVLDFGLAKALDTEARHSSSSLVLSQSPTITGPMTGANVLLGTAAYMSPEQARGQTSDRRADIWAFGVVLYEMLTGKRLFEGETVSDTLASVLRSEPDWEALPKETPARVRRLLRRCLERDPKKRLRDIGEARIVLDEVVAGVPDETVPATAKAKPKEKVSVALGIALAAALAGSLATGFANRLFENRAPEAPLRKFRLLSRSMSDAQMISPVLSPDGRMLAYVSEQKLWIQDLDKADARPYSLDPAPEFLFWSPDSRHVGVLARQRIFKFAVEGGQSQLVCETPMAFAGGSGAFWTEDNRIVFSQAESLGIQEVAAVGGTPHRVLAIDASQETDFHEPTVLPDGKTIVFVTHLLGRGTRRMETLHDGKREVLLEDEESVLSKPCYSPTGHILYSKSQPTPGIYALPFSIAKRKATGEPFLVTSDALEPTLSRDGSLAYREQQLSQIRELVWLDASGGPVADLSPIVSEHPIQGRIGISPEGARVIFSEVRGNESDLWIQDVRRGTKTRLTFGPGQNFDPTWSPAGDLIYYRWGPTTAATGREFRILVRRADGTGGADTLGAGGVPQVSPDGRTVLWTDLRGPTNNWRIVRRDVGTAGDAVVVLEGAPWLFSGRVDPRQRWLSYVSNESGEWEVYLTSYPSGQGRWQVSTRGGQWPSWNARGDRLYFLQGDDIMEVGVAGDAVPQLDVPRRLFTRASMPVGRFGIARSFAVTGDGQRFLTLAPSRQQEDKRGAILVQNWFAEFKKK